MRGHRPKSDAFDASRIITLNKGSPSNTFRVAQHHAAVAHLNFASWSKRRRWRHSRSVGDGARGSLLRPNATQSHQVHQVGIAASAGLQGTHRRVVKRRDRRQGTAAAVPSAKLSTLKTVGLKIEAKDAGEPLKTCG